MLENATGNNVVAKRCHLFFGTRMFVDIARGRILNS